MTSEGKQQPDRDRLIERVKKLYAMARETDSSPHEAEIALRRCQSLMAKFGIQESDLETSDFGARRIDREFRAIPGYVKLLGSAVALLHDCLCVSGRTIEFRGYRVDTEVAGLSYDYLLQSMERSLRQRKSAGLMPPGRAASFDYRVGFAAAVLERCREIDAERRAAERHANSVPGESSGDSRGESRGESLGGGALVVRKLAAVRANCAQGLSTRRPSRIRYRDGAAHAAGSDDGTQVSLDAQIGAPGKRDRITEA